MQVSDKRATPGRPGLLGDQAATEKAGYIGRPGQPDICNAIDERATLGRPSQPAIESKTNERATLGRPSQPEPKPLAEWADHEIEAAILEISGLFAGTLALDTVRMTEPELQEHERRLHYLFDMRETLQIEQIRRDAERLKQAALCECLVIFSMSTNGEGGQPRTPALARTQKDAENAGQPRTTGFVRTRKNERM
jgi:hypothetical protein